MSQTVKKISVTFNAINNSNTFTNGDIIRGQIVVELAKDTQIDTLVIKLKGKAHVHWTDHRGKDRDRIQCTANEKLLKLKQYFMTEDKSNDTVLLRNEEGQHYCNVVAPGTHVYPFTFQFPQQILPASVKVLHGYVSYFLEAKLSRSMKIPNQAKAEFRYIPKPDLTIPDLMTPQHGNTEKKALFTSGKVSFSMQTERMGHYLGQGIKVVLDVQNDSSRSLKPKYSLTEKHTFHARGRRERTFHTIQKEEGEPIPPSTKTTITKVLTIPPSANLSILNCKVLEVEHYLKVYLDVPYATDPEIVVPVVILSGPPAKDMAAPPQSSVGFEGYWNPGQEGWSSAPYVAPPPAYDSYGLYPPLPNYSGKP